MKASVSVVSNILAAGTRACIGEGVYISSLQGAPGTSIVEDSFSTDGGQEMALVLPSAGFILLCSLVPNRPWWVPVLAQKLGVPGLYRVGGESGALGGNCPSSQPDFPSSEA